MKIDEGLRLAKKAQERSLYAQRIVERLANDLRLHGYSIPVEQGQQMD